MFIYLLTWVGIIGLLYLFAYLSQVEITKTGTINHNKEEPPKNGFKY